MLVSRCVTVSVYVVRTGEMDGYVGGRMYG
jgi:hypothetical protein